MISHNCQAYALRCIPGRTRIFDNKMLPKNTIFCHLRVISLDPSQWRTFLLLISFGTVFVLSPVLAAQKHSLMGSRSLPLQFTSTIPETFTTSLQVTVP